MDCEIQKKFLFVDILNSTESFYFGRSDYEQQKQHIGSLVAREASLARFNVLIFIKDFFSTGPSNTPI